MELKQKRLSFFQLLGCALKTANRVFGAALGLYFLMLLWIIALAIIAVLLFRMMGPQVMMMAPLLQIPLGLINGFFGIVLSMALLQLIAARIEDRKIGVFHSIKISLLPSVYFLLSSILLAIGFIIIFVAAALSHSAIVVFFTYVVLFFVCLPFWFVQQAIALREQGPINALIYSWKLGIANYGRLLLMLLMACGCVFIIVLAVACVIKALLSGTFISRDMLQFQIMMWMAQTPKLYIFFGLLIFALLYGYALLTFISFTTALFLNLDYNTNGFGSDDTAEMLDISEIEQEAVPVVPVPVNTPKIEVTHASVSTFHEEVEPSHLEQVYQAQDHVAQTLEQEEDRMPTILFDEDMARQLQENERKMQEKQTNTNKNSQDEGPASIKMSDKPL